MPGCFLARFVDFTPVSRNINQQLWWKLKKSRIETFKVADRKRLVLPYCWSQPRLYNQLENYLQLKVETKANVRNQCKRKEPWTALLVEYGKTVEYTT